ncbi:hypothetical protein TNIN_482441 [Trichonephila inaurata madagascariensis]|uniref:Uncharacterized protein n=1 Tax=Trichonephila inaurata madagascariensis TaxID=2747483 RepID=A0A8X6I897_9ARAC|nr:hypothetical protein TNIN_482441 [Trichonephila inaurata madagascariensis]
MARTKQTARKTAQTTAVTTNLPPPTDHEICNELMTIQGRLEFLRCQMTATEKSLIRCRLGTIRILPLHDEMREKMTRNAIRHRHSSAKVRENISYANALKGYHEMAPPPEQTRSKSNETPLGENRQPVSAAEDESFGFMDAIIELKKFFTDYLF